MDQNEQDTVEACLISEFPDGYGLTLPATEDWCGCCETPHARFRVLAKVDLSGMMLTLSFVDQKGSIEEELYISLKTK